MGDLLVSKVLTMSLLELATGASVQEGLVPQLSLGKSLNVLVRLRLLLTFA